MPVKRTVNQGHDRMTRVADRALQAIESDPEYREGDRVIVVLSGVDQGGMGLAGYVPPEGEDLARLDLGRILRALDRTGKPELTGKPPAGLARAGGPGWLSQGKGKPPGTPG